MKLLSKLEKAFVIKIFRRLFVILIVGDRLDGEIVTFVTKEREFKRIYTIIMQKFIHSIRHVDAIEKNLARDRYVHCETEPDMQFSHNSYSFLVNVCVGALISRIIFASLMALLHSKKKRRVCVCYMRMPASRVRL